MSTLVDVAPTKSRRSSTSRILLWLLLALLVILAGAVAYAYYIAHAALPQLDGRLQIAGLSAPVTVTRDSHGVPTIEAASLEDLFFAQGYVTAQDRLWQMDIMRRYGSGELSEILGEDTLKLDREQRILGLRAAARKAIAIASPRDRSFFEAYARGVNAFIGTHGGKLPLEFRILHYGPKPWLPEDSVVIANSMVKDLNFHYFYDALAREKILAKLGPDLTADLYVNRSWHDRPPTVMREDLNQPDVSAADSDDDDSNDDDPIDNSVTELVVRVGPGLEPGQAARAALRPLTGSETRSHTGLLTGPETWSRTSLREETSVTAPELPVNGSNDWVVSGAHTVTGKPLLSNDMHLGHQMPNLWYEAHLHSGTLDVAGVTLPGMPYVIVGHNQRIAWGFTNVGPTVTDVFIENFNSQGAYQTPSGWVEPEHRAETIHVKGNADVNLDVKITRHGPVITELVPGETRPLALRWTLYDGLHIPFFDVNAAQNWEQFRRAFSQLDAPGQNVVYADVDGNIGYQATGKIPIRAAGDGSLPVSGTDNAHEWTSYIPFEKLPRKNHTGRLSKFHQHGVGSSVAHGAHLPRAGIGATVLCGGHARTANRHSIRSRLVRGGTLGLRGGSCFQAFGKSEASGRSYAELGWTHAGFFGGADYRRDLDSRIATIAARTEIGKCHRRFRQGRRGSELEDLLVGDAFGMDGEHSAASAETLAAGKIFEL